MRVKDRENLLKYLEKVSRDIDKKLTELLTAEAKAGKSIQDDPYLWLGAGYALAFDVLVQGLRRILHPGERNDEQ